MHLKELRTPEAMQTYPLWQTLKEKLTPGQFLQLYRSAVDNGKGPTWNEAAIVESVFRKFPEYEQYYAR
jgi:hypothetical protein